MLHALADAEYGRVAGAQLVVHDDAALHLQACRLRLVHVRPDAAANDHHVRVEYRAVLELQAGDGAVAEQVRRNLFQQDLYAHAFEQALQQRGPGGVELLNHQVRGDFDDGDVEVVT